MIDWLVNRLFWWTPLRNALFAEVHMYDQLDGIMSDPDRMKTGSVMWFEDGLWKGWVFNRDLNRYIFNDIGGTSIFDILDLEWKIDEYNMDEVW
jgi:hypothetical protein